MSLKFKYDILDTTYNLRAAVQNHIGKNNNKIVAHNHKQICYLSRIWTLIRISGSSFNIKQTLHSSQTNYPSGKH